MEALVLPGWEVGETPGTIATFSGLMGHLGTTTAAGHRVSQIILGVKIVFKPGRPMGVNGMI